MNILVVDDDKLVAMSLRMIIEADPDMTVVDVGYSAADAIRLYKKHLPDVLLMDIRMADRTGLAAGAEIRAQYPNAKILYLTTFNDDEYIVKALSIGARGYIIKQDFESIIPALKAVQEGQTVFGSDVVGRLPSMIRQEKQEGFDREAFGLSEQEAEVMRLISCGLSNREIADKLCLSEGTVRNYISNILAKLNLRDRTNLAIFYLTGGKPTRAE